MERAQRKKYFTVYGMPSIGAFRRRSYALKECWIYNNSCRSQLMEMTLFVIMLV